MVEILRCWLIASRKGLDKITFYNSNSYIQHSYTVLMKHRVIWRILAETFRVLTSGPPLYRHSGLHNSPDAQSQASDREGRTRPGVVWFQDGSGFAAKGLNLPSSCIGSSFQGGELGCDTHPQIPK